MFEYFSPCKFEKLLKAIDLTLRSSKIFGRLSAISKHTCVFTHNSQRMICQDISTVYIGAELKFHDTLARRNKSSYISHWPIQKQMLRETSTVKQ